MIRVRYLLTIVFIGLCTFVVGVADTLFTYQGELNENGQVTNGLFDFEFVLWDAQVDGNQVGPPFVINDVQVFDGRFTVELDFGADAFDNTSRWLEIAVNGTELSPRQPVTRSPYAIQTRGIFVDENNRVGVGTFTPSDSLHVRKQTTTPDLPERMLIVDSHDDPNLFDLQLGSGSGILFKVPYQNDSRIGAAIDAVRTTNVEINSETALVFSVSQNNETLDEAMRIDQLGRIGIGTSTPSYPLHVVSDGQRTIFGHNTTANGNTFGVWGQSDSLFGRGVLGLATATAGTNYGVWGESNSDSGRGVSGLATSTSNTNANFGVWGQSNNINGFDFFAAGAGQDYGAASSIRWKSNIRNIDQPLDKIARLRGVYYDWDTEHGGNHDVGMIAEEVGKVMPEIVNYEENGVDAIGMDYSKMTPLLVEAVNAVRAEKDRDITTLREAHAAEINDLREQLSNLQQIVERLASNQEKENR